MNPPAGLGELLAGLGNGSLDPGTTLAEARDRIDALPAEARVVRHRFEAEGNREGPWWGVPYLNKANLATRGESLDCCSAILDGFRAPYDATVTARLRAAGATCLGSTNMDEFGMGSSGETSVMGVTPHPFLRGRVCGGSSSGAAAAVALGLVPFALGSDTGGSVRQPAAYCGLVGLKPTWGRISRYGLVAHASSLDTVGVLVASVTDATEVLACIEGPDGNDSTVDASLGPVVPVRPRSFAVLRPADGSVSPAVAASLERAVDALDLPAADIELPALEPALSAYVVIAAAETASNLARYDGSLYGARVEADSFEESVSRARTAGFGDEVKLRILLGTEVLRRGHTENALGRARSLVARLDAEFNAVFEAHDAVLMPTVPDVAFDIGTRVSDPLAMREADRFTVGPSLLGLPAVAVPVGTDQNGAPLSVQCVAARGRDDLALGLAATVEAMV